MGVPAVLKIDSEDKAMASPRVLTITFRLRVPNGLRANIRDKRLETAVSRSIWAGQASARPSSRGPPKSR
jgi:hypothetical protein